MNRSTPGLPVHHQLPEFTQTHIHWVRDAIQPSHPLPSPSPPAPNPSQHQSLFQGVNSSHEYWSFRFSIIPSKEIPGLIFRMDWLDLLAVQGTHIIKHNFLPLKIEFVTYVFGMKCGTSGKELACQYRKHERSRFDLWVRKIPWRRAWQPTPVFLPGNFHGQKSLAGYNPWGHRVIHDWVSTHTHTHTCSWP